MVCTLDRPREGGINPRPQLISEGWKYKKLSKSCHCQDWLDPQPVPNGYPLPDPNPKFFSIPDPYPICFQNLRVFRVSGISEYYVFDMENGIKEQQDIDQYHFISSSLDLTGLIFTSMYCGLISMGLSSITISPLCFHGFSICSYGKLFPAPN